MTPAGEPLLRVDRLRVRLLKEPGFEVLRGVDLDVGRGEIVGLVGANGAGKTTLLRIAAGLMRADQGTVRWDPSWPRIRYFGGESTLPTAGMSSSCTRSRRISITPAT